MYQTACSPMLFPHTFQSSWNVCPRPRAFWPCPQWTRNAFQQLGSGRVEKERGRRRWPKTLRNKRVDTHNKWTLRHCDRGRLTKSTSFLRIEIQMLCQVTQDGPVMQWVGGFHPRELIIGGDLARFLNDFPINTAPSALSTQKHTPGRPWDEIIRHISLLRITI